MTPGDRVELLRDDIGNEGRTIVATALGEDLKPVSPLITIIHGGSNTERIIQVTIPIRVPDYHLAMAFYCDESTGELEGIPGRKMP